ncbi:PREB isoform 5, partial [Pongo abelii]
QPAGLRLFTVQIPHKRLRQPPPCYLTAWDGSNFLPLRTKSCGHEVVSCLNVSESGTFLGLGTVTGSVAIYIAFSLQCLYYVREAHGIVVTDVAFLPEKGRGPELLGSHETALFSVAVDSRCQLHLLPSRECSCVAPAPAVCWAYCCDHSAAPECLSRFPLASLLPGNQEPGHCHL